ncbi:threonine synthase [Caldicellulosiruptor kronotskyensis 2002]|uniref:Threonine synthase n=1 Tax=Caldicellulosiruptor kronotskyensis (strain DSM 18902 / VKM B-2412 / 2002) TaxID=632348 RepID=E4SGE0_CALK2|nr:threonine synthase [Caldicellulosiruptor kronotskyensis]ADQ46815.1 threonine synthase [Caldicellulosiruptor kronotskyensis 2002]
MRYISTRGNKEVKAKEAIYRGIAEDGGLYTPVFIPHLDLSKIKNIESYANLAKYIFELYLTDFTNEEIIDCIDKSYSNGKFDTKDVVVLKKLDSSLFALELWHGPTYAFKDVALQVLPHLLLKSMPSFYKQALILVATSGDTGKAALEGFKDVDRTKIVVFYPSEGVSEVQKRQMTTQEGRNTFVAGIKGNFDDAQSGVKEIFTSKKCIDEIENLGFFFTSANSINFGRLLPQIVYYIWSYLVLLKAGDISEGEKINFVVPTGNFGNILAGFIAKLMGVPINKLIVASNINSVVADFVRTGLYDRRREFYKTISPSMDILVASNLERLLYLITKESERVKKYMMDLKSEGYFKVEEEVLKEIQESFWGDFSTDDQTRSSIKIIYREYDYLIDPHSAVGFDVYRKYQKQTFDSTKTVVLQTANPYKFAKDVLNALFDGEYNNIDPFEAVEILYAKTGVEIPDGIKSLLAKPILHPDVIEKDKMFDFILEKIRDN